MSFDKYSDKAAEAIALIREFAKVEYWDFFKGDPEQALEAFCAMQDAAEEMGRMKTQDSASPQDNVPGVSELPPLPTPCNATFYPNGVTYLAKKLPVGSYFTGPQMIEYAKEYGEACVSAALRAYGQRAAVVVPKGYRLVPLEPTHEMLNAAQKKWHYSQSWETASDCYRALVAAAPSQPQQEAVPAEPSEQDKLLKLLVSQHASSIRRMFCDGRPVGAELIAAIIPQMEGNNHE